MAVFRVVKNENYTTICNEHLRDKRLSLKAKGLLTIMLSLPETWDYSVAGLVAICKEGRTAVEAALKELKEQGYLVVEKLPPTKGERSQFEYIYNVYESPSRGLSQGAGNLPLENHEQLNTKESIQPGSDSQVSSGEEDALFDVSPKTESKGRFTPPTPDEVYAYAQEKGYTWFTPTDSERFCGYWESRGWARKGEKMKSWQGTLTTWALKDKPEEKEQQGTPMPQSFRDKIEQENQRMYRILGYEKGLKKEGV